MQRTLRGTDYARSVPQAIECNSQEQAVENVMRICNEVGIVFSNETMASVPYAIACGWRSPEECAQFVREMLKEHKNREE